MEIMLKLAILICLLLVIALLCVDKVNIIRGEKTSQTKTVDRKFPEIMGKPIMHSIERASKKLIVKKAADRKENVSYAIIKEPIDKVEPNSTIDSKLDTTDDFSDEEDIPPDDERFGQGVSLDELMKVGNLLQQNSVEEIHEQEIITVMQKIQGTELYGILESSIGDASQRIARLLDQNLNNNDSADYGLEDNFDKFNIDDFI